MWGVGGEEKRPVSGIPDGGAVAGRARQDSNL
jgi:hypothetical protein